MKLNTLCSKPHRWRWLIDLSFTCLLFRRVQGINAAPFGVVGVLVYTDPYDINDGKMSDENETFPHSWYLPPSGVERGSYKTNFGDQLTPYLAAKSKNLHIYNHSELFKYYVKQWKTKPNFRWHVQNWREGHPGSVSHSSPANRVWRCNEVHMVRGEWFALTIPVRMYWLLASLMNACDDYDSELDGFPAPDSWQGSFPCKYNYGGPGFKPESQFKNW